MKMRLALIAMAVMLALCFGAMAEDAGDLAFGDEEAFSYSFEEGGYAGAWVSVDELGIEFYLPEGWVEGEHLEDESFYAESPDGTARLAIIGYDEDFEGATLIDWAEENVMDDYTIMLVNDQEVVVVRDDDFGTYEVLVPDVNGLISFSFVRESEGALSDMQALQIAGTCSDTWG